MNDENEKITFLPGADSAGRHRTAKRQHLHLVDRVDDEEFDTLMVINGLRGVCKALERLAVSDPNDDLACDLTMAASVLSAIVAARVD